MCPQIWKNVRILRILWLETYLRVYAHVDLHLVACVKLALLAWTVSPQADESSVRRGLKLFFKTQWGKIVYLDMFRVNMRDKVFQAGYLGTTVFPVAHTHFAVFFYKFFIVRLDVNRFLFKIWLRVYRSIGYLGPEPYSLIIFAVFFSEYRFYHIPKSKIASKFS